MESVACSRQTILYKSLERRCRNVHMIGGMNFVLGCVENKQLREVDSFCQYRREKQWSVNAADGSR